jgi:hypothetical protein
VGVVSPLLNPKYLLRSMLPQSSANSYMVCTPWLSLQADRGWMTCKQCRGVLPVFFPLCCRPPDTSTCYRWCLTSSDLASSLPAAASCSTAWQYMDGVPCWFLLLCHRQLLLNNLQQRLHQSLRAAHRLNNYEAAGGNAQLCSTCQWPASTLCWSTRPPRAGKAGSQLWWCCCCCWLLL